MESFYAEEELKDIGFKSLGKDVKISRNTCIYNAEKISIGSHVRIDDFCRMSGEIHIGDYVHIAVYSGLFGGKSGIYIDDFCNISSRCMIYAESDDYSGEMMPGALIPAKYKKVISEKVVLKKHVIIGTSSVILPGVILAEGTSGGAMTLLNKSTEPWGVYVGIPARRLHDRKRDLLSYEKYFLQNEVGKL